MVFEAKIEDELIRAMKRLAVPYQSALAILRRQCLTAPGDPNRVTAELQPSIHLIAECERLLSPVRQQWIALATPAGPQLRQMIDQQSELLEELLSLMKQVEAQLTSSRSQLATRLDASVRQSAMRQAYHA